VRGAPDFLVRHHAERDGQPRAAVNTSAGKANLCRPNTFDRVMAHSLGPSRAAPSGHGTLR
jgi:hypothetical protein